MIIIDCHKPPKVNQVKHILILLSLFILTFPLVAQETGVLYFKKVNGKYGWFENGNDKKDWKYNELKKIIHTSVRFMDNVNDKTQVPLKSQKDNLKSKRRIGLGILGYGSSLLIARIKYGSTKALELTENLMKFFHLLHKIKLK